MLSTGRATNRGDEKFLLSKILVAVAVNNHTLIVVRYTLTSDVELNVRVVLLSYSIVDTSLVRICADDRRMTSLALVKHNSLPREIIEIEVCRSNYFRVKIECN